MIEAGGKTNWLFSNYNMHVQDWPKLLPNIHNQWSTCLLNTRQTATTTNTHPGTYVTDILKVVKNMTRRNEHTNILSLAAIQNYYFFISFGSESPSFLN